MMRVSVFRNEEDQAMPAPWPLSFGVFYAPFHPVGQDPTGAATFVEEMRALADVGVDEVSVMPLQGDPVAFVRSLGEHVVPRLSQL